MGTNPPFFHFFIKKSKKGEKNFLGAIFSRRVVVLSPNMFTNVSMTQEKLNRNTEPLCLISKNNYQRHWESQTNNKCIIYYKVTKPLHFFFQDSTYYSYFSIRCIMEVSNKMMLSDKAWLDKFKIQGFKGIRQWTSVLNSPMSPPSLLTYTPNITGLRPAKFQDYFWSSVMSGRYNLQSNKKLFKIKRLFS